MRSVRTLPPLFLLPSWTQVHLRGLRKFSTPHDGPLRPRTENQAVAPKDETAPTHSPSIKSLLEELFPEAVKKQDDAASVDREVPRLPLLTNHAGIEERKEHSTSRHGQPEEMARARIRRIGARQRSDIRRIAGDDRDKVAVVLLSRVSKHLTESDLRRVVPQGEHIKDWRLHGDILQVIHGRDPNTLEAKGFYYILFSSASSASTFQDHASRLYEATRTQAFRKSASRDSPNSGAEAFDKGQDIDELRQSFTLAPPTIKPLLQVQTPPFHPYTYIVLKRGGYPRAFSDNYSTPQAAQPTTALLRIDGEDNDLSLGAVEEVLRMGPRFGRPRPWPVHRPAKADRRSRERQGAPGADGWVVPSAREVVETPKSSIEADAQSQVRVPFRRYVLNKPETERLSSRWIIPFKTETQARRFVREWHKRSFPRVNEDWTIQDEDTGLSVNVEVMW